MAAANDDQPIPAGGLSAPLQRQEATSQLLNFLRASGHTPDPCLRTLDMFDHYFSKNTQASAELIPALTANTNTPSGTLTQSLEIATAALNALAHEFHVTQRPTVEKIRTALAQAPHIVPQDMAGKIADMRAAVATFDTYHTAFDKLSRQSTELASLWTRHHNCLRFIENYPDTNAPKYRQALNQTLREQGFSGAAALQIANNQSVGAQQLLIQQAVSEDLQALRHSISTTSDTKDPASGLAQLIDLATSQLARADAAMQQLYEAAKARHEARGKH